MADVEVLHFVANRVYTFNMNGVTPSPSGYKASDIMEKTGNKHMWTGGLRIVGRGDQNLVLLEHCDDGKSGVYVSVEANNKNVEPVFDSSRFFILRVVNKQSGKVALVALAFNEKNIAYDFKVALRDCQVKDEPKEMIAISTPSLDLGLKEGQTIHVNIKTKKTASTSSTTSSVISPTSSSTSSSSSSSLSLSQFTLAPPNSTPNVRQGNHKKKNSALSPEFSDFDFDSTPSSPFSNVSSPATGTKSSTQNIHDQFGAMNLDFLSSPSANSGSSASSINQKAVSSQIDEFDVFAAVSSASSSSATSSKSVDPFASAFSQSSAANVKAVSTGAQSSNKKKVTDAFSNIGSMDNWNF
jgi:hypothetical protein